MANIFATVLLTPNPGKIERVKELLVTIARQVEETQRTVLQYQLFEELVEEREDHKGNTKIIVHINFADGEAINQYHALTTFQNFWNAIPEEDLLAVPLDPMKCKVFGGFAVRT